MTIPETNLILGLCREAGDDTSDVEATLEAFRANHDPDLIAEAARGNAEAIFRLRRACGLPVLS
jgi:hypothetical protein